MPSERKDSDDFDVATARRKAQRLALSGLIAFGLLFGLLFALLSFLS